MIRIEQIKLPVEHDRAELEKKIRKILRIRDGATMPDHKIKRRSLDARWKPDLMYVYTVDVFCDPKEESLIAKHCREKNVRFIPEESYRLPGPVVKKPSKRPVVIGSGPAGLFCAYLLALSGMEPIVVERGETAKERSARVDAVWEGRQKLHPDSNVQFGEGGAGTFSDGKLKTLVKDKYFRNQFVLDTFVRFGAPEEVSFAAKPHLGTDVLRSVVTNMRNEILSYGGTFLFGLRLDDIRIKNGQLKTLCFTKTFDLCDLPTGFSEENGTISYTAQTAVLAIGHSARDTFSMLYEKDLNMEQKNFAVGLRIEHPQEMIDHSQYGEKYQGKLPPADYKLTTQTSNGRSVYSFCMCPGGYVVNASSEEGCLAVNGMSYSGRESQNANAALIVSVNGTDFGSDHPLAGMEFQRKLEKKAYEIGEGKIPVQRLDDYRNDCLSTGLNRYEPCMKGQHTFANLRQLFTTPVNEALDEAIHTFGTKIEGFDDADAILSGVESRTSSPVRIVRGDDLMSNIKGIYPCGEGAGYAGGITSAAMDGMKVAEAIISAYKKQTL